MSGAKQERERRRRAREYEARKAVHAIQEERRSKDAKTWLGALAAVAVAATAAQVFFFTGGPGASPTAAETPAATAPQDPLATDGADGGQAPDPALAEGRTWTGDMTINGIPLAVELDGAKAPQAVANMIALSEQGYYDGTPCHRLTTYPEMTVLQCGDPTGTGTGDPGYKWGPVENAPADDVYPAGTIAMARQGGDGDSMGSQFFIVFEDAQIPSDAAGGYTVLGTITGGLDELRDAVVKPGVEGGAQDGAPATTTTLDSIDLK